MGRDGIASATHGKGSTTIYSIKNRLTFFKERDERKKKHKTQ
jgi:hypothetical protein